MVGAILPGFKGIVSEGESFTLQKIHSGSGARSVTSVLLLFPPNSCIPRAATVAIGTLSSRGYSLRLRCQQSSVILQLKEGACA